MGVLTKLQSEKISPLVKYIEKYGKTPVVRAVVKGSKIKADVTLRVVDAASIDDEWLERVAEDSQFTENNEFSGKRPEFEWDNLDELNSDLLEDNPGEKTDPNSDV